MKEQRNKITIAEDTLYNSFDNVPITKLVKFTFYTMFEADRVNQKRASHAGLDSTMLERIV